MASNALERFYRLVSPEPNSGCWLWEGCADRKGYGQFYFCGRQTKAHRVAWRIFKGEIPSGLWVLHNCDVSHCINPGHLYLGTAKDNAQDMVFRGRQVFMRNPHKAARGEKCARSKLTADQVEKILLSSLGRYELAAQFSVTYSAIALIKTGRTWRHVRPDILR